MAKRRFGKLGAGKALKPFPRRLSLGIGLSLGIVGGGILSGISPALAGDSKINGDLVETVIPAIALPKTGPETDPETGPENQALLHSQRLPEFFDESRSRRTAISVASYDASNPFNALVGRKRKRNKNKPRSLKRVRLYVLSDGEKSFLFHDTGSQARIQFLCGNDDKRIECNLDGDRKSSEVHTLAVTRAPRGDVIYKDSEGNTLLRIASYGGATVWWPGDIEARAASRSFSDLTEINFKAVNGRKALRRANRATALLSALTGKPIEFRTPLDGVAYPPSGFDPAETTQSSIEGGQAEARIHNEYESSEPIEQVFARSPNLRESSVLADAILVTSKGMAAVAADPTGARVMGTRLLSVEFVRSPTPLMRLENGRFQIGYSVAGGLQGRPSSAQITRFLEENL